MLTLAGAQTVSAVFAWRDLSRRTDAQVRGKKKLWRVLLVMNPGNSTLYWTVGRRRRVSSPGSLSG